MTKWLEKTLGEVTSFMKKGIPPKYTVEESEKTIRVLNQKCNRNFEISYSESRLHDCEKKIVPADKMLRAGDVLINSTGIGTAGRVAQVVEVKGPTTIDGHMILLRPSEELNPIYYGYAVKAFQSQIEGLAEGSTGQTEINRMRLQDEVIIKYPKDKLVQENIGRFLSNIDDKIKTNTEINKNLEEQAQAIFKSWFVDFEPFGGIQPSEMQFIPLQELCKVVTKGTTPTTLGKSFTSTGINFIKAESILDNHSIDSSKFAFIDEETNALLKRSVIKANDIVFTIAGTLGRFAMVDNSVLPANTNQAVAIIRPDETKVTPAYLYSFFIGNWHNEYYSKRIQQAVQANLSLTTIKSLPIAVLKNTTMNNYDKLVSPLFALMKSNEEENRRLSKLRDTLLPRLMSGELDVSNLDL
ncbi:restriction endonuclease subunit S [Lactobacillus iners]|uniref:restriction endonuclease subunit S n=2 Tax=Lactobacillus iners TaxID=147802 RepID=UPI001F0977DB|nr:restriction endonuclease subunit S [Lactobacillus iners]MCT7771082.1 restriction endonuclease subunit S [Lactobacillus iners]